MTVNCLWEHNGGDTLLHALDFPGAYTRGVTLDAARTKMPAEIASYLRWRGDLIPDTFDIVIAGEQNSELAIRDADSDVLFEQEKARLTRSEYETLKSLALRSARDFLNLYDSIPDKDASAAPPRQTFYGPVPRTAREMYAHTKSVNAYYFAEIDVPADNDGDIFSCRRRGFEALERRPDFLKNPVLEGSYGEQWTLRKVLRRFLWHDRIHARAMYRMAVQCFGPDWIADPFFFSDPEATRRELQCKIYPLGSLGDYKFTVICTSYRGQWVLSRHKSRTTWETQGGHIEPGETPLDCARRELYEESGVRDADLYPVCDYLGYNCRSRAKGMVFLAVVRTLGHLPDSEMQEIKCFDVLPNDLTYPRTSPKLYAQAERVLQNLTE